MSSDPSQAGAGIKLDTATKLACERTLLAHERTQMAWVRTTLAFITFGFTISKFFEYIRLQRGSGATLFGPQAVGILMIAIGLTSMGVATVYRRLAVTKLRTECPELPRYPVGVMGTLVLLLGIAAMLNALFQ